MPQDVILETARDISTRVTSFAAHLRSARRGSLMDIRARRRGHKLRRQATG
jgi:hypothetical protein